MDSEVRFVNDLAKIVDNSDKWCVEDVFGVGPNELTVTLLHISFEQNELNVGGYDG